MFIASMLLSCVKEEKQVRLWTFLRAFVTVREALRRFQQSAALENIDGSEANVSASHRATDLVLWSRLGMREHHASVIVGFHIAEKAAKLRIEPLRIPNVSHHEAPFHLNCINLARGPNLI